MPPGRRVPGCPTARFYCDKPSGEGVCSPRAAYRNLVVIVVVMIVSVVMVIITVMVGHRIAYGRATNPAHDGADWAAHNRSANRASDASGHGST